MNRVKFFYSHGFERTKDLKRSSWKPWDIAMKVNKLNPSTHRAPMVSTALSETVARKCWTSICYSVLYWNQKICRFFYLNIAFRRLARSLSTVWLKREYRASSGSTRASQSSCRQGTYRPTGPVCCQCRTFEMGSDEQCIHPRNRLQPQSRTIQTRNRGCALLVDSW